MEKKKYSVDLSRVEYMTTTIVVEAENEEEAKELAMDEASSWNIHDADQEVTFVQQQQ